MRIKGITCGQAQPGEIFWEEKNAGLGDQSGSCGAQHVIAEAAVPFPGGHWAAAALFGAALFMVFSSEQREIC